MFLPTNLPSCLGSNSRKSGSNHVHVLLSACLEKIWQLLKKGCSACEFPHFLLLARRVTHSGALSILPDSVPLFCYKHHYSHTLITRGSSYRWSLKWLQYVWILRLQIRRCFIFCFSLFSFLQLFVVQVWWHSSKLVVPCQWDGNTSFL